MTEIHYQLYAIANFVNLQCRQRNLGITSIDLHINPMTMSEIEMAALKEADTADWESFLKIGYPVPDLHLEGIPRIAAVYGIRIIHDDNVPRGVVRVAVRDIYDDPADGGITQTTNESLSRVEVRLNELSAQMDTRFNAVEKLLQFIESVVEFWGNANFGDN